MIGTKLTRNLLQNLRLPKMKLTYHGLRRITLHEYQCGDLLRRYNIPVLKGEAATTPEQAYQIAQKMQEEIGDLDFVVKAQIHAGGRSKGFVKENNFQGGVHVVSTPEEVKELAEKMIGNTLVTKQTGPDGRPINYIYIVERAFLRRELYFACFLDRANAGPCFLYSSKGGVNIEEIDKKYIHKTPIDIVSGLTSAHVREIVENLNLPQELHSTAAQIVEGTYKCFIENDATLVEINPLAITPDKQLLVCDTKINIDDNSKFRRQYFVEQEDQTQKDPKEIEAGKVDLNYIALDGNIGCMVNGAGLAMATMDLIKLKGGSPANFLDVGGGAGDDQVFTAMKILNEDPHVEAILVNIFAGITRCDMIALGVIRGCQQLHLHKPIVLRLKGTKIEEAKEIINQSGFSMFLTEDLEEAALKAVKMSQIIKMARDAKINISLS